MDVPLLCVVLAQVVPGWLGFEGGRDPLAFDTLSCWVVHQSRAS